VKKNIAKTALIVLAVLLTSALLSAGILAIIFSKNVATKGNVLGIDWYSEDEKEFTITTAEELYEFARLSDYYDFKGQVVKLGADIVINEGNAEDWRDTVPELRWKPIESFAGTFDGQGHSIAGLYARGYNTKLALFANTKGSCLVKDTKLTNSYLESRGFGGVSGFASGGGGKFEKLYSDAILNVVGAYSGYAGGICSKMSLTANIKECWFDGLIMTTGRTTGGILDEIDGTKVTISNCLFSGTIKGTYDHSGAVIGGILGRTSTKGASVEVENSLSSGKISTKHEDKTGMIIGEIAEGTSFRSVNSYAVAKDFPGIGLNGSNGSMYILPLQVKESNIKGMDAYRWLDLDFDKTWCVVENEAPVLQCFAKEIPSIEGVERAFDVSWYKEKTQDNVISTKEQLRGFYILSGRTLFENTTIKLGADIVLNEGNASTWLTMEPEEEWYQIDGFSGTFDGQGHSISGIYINEVGRYHGFFKTTRGSIVKNFSLKNSTIINLSGNDLSTGSIAGVGHGTFENVYSDAIMNLSGFMAGGLLGQVYDVTTVKGCWYDGKITSLGRYTGGIIGAVTGSKVTVENCLNSGSIDITWPPGFANSGGIVGSTFYDKGLGLTIKGCLNTGIITSRQEGMGSVLGHCVDGTVNISDTYAVEGSNTIDGKGVGYVQAIVNGGAIHLPEQLLTGYKAFDWSTLDFDSSWSVVLNDTPVPKYFAESSPSVAGRSKEFDIRWYDAAKDTFTIKTTKELYGLCIVAGATNFKGKTVKLANDISLNTGDAENWLVTPPEKIWLPIMDFAGTFDGQGHTISGMYAQKSGRYSGFFGSTTQTAVVKNVSLKNSLVKNHGGAMLSTGSVAGVAHGRFENIYSNAIVDAKGTELGGILGQIYQDTTVSGCWYDGRVQCNTYGRYAGGVVGVVTGGKVNIEHCLNTGEVIIKVAPGMVNSGGILGACYYGENIVVNITDCFNAGTLSSPWDGMGSVLGHCVDGVVNIKNTYATKESNTVDGKAIGWIQGTVNGNVGQLPENMLLGINAYRALNLDFDKYWAAVANATPQLKQFTTNALSVAGVEKLYDTTWYDAGKKEYTITTKEQLYGLSLVSTYEDFKGKTIRLGKDISLNKGNAADWIANAPENMWAPMMDFAGTFDGQGHTISGMYVSKDARFAGFFGTTTTNAVVKNFSLKNSLVKNHANKMLSTGSVAGVAHGKFTKIYSNAIVDATGTDLGGMFGQIYENTTVSECWFDGTVQCKTLGRYAGGVVGIVTGGTANIEHCLNTGTVEVNFNGMVNSGGILGSCYYDKKLTVNITDCFNSGTIKAPYDGTGSIVGHVVDGTVNVEKCYATAESNTVDGKAVGWINKDNKAVLNGNPTQFPTSMILGINGYKLTYLDFNNYWAAVENKTPQLKSFTKGALSIEGVAQLYDKFDPNATTYVLHTKQDLYDFALMACTTDFAGKTIKLGKDIVLNTGKAADWANTAPANEWIPVEEFAGKFDGQGHTISGVYIKKMTNSSGNWEPAGFFETLTETAEVCNLGIVNSYIRTDTYYTGTVAGISCAKRIENVYSDAIIHNSHSTGVWDGHSLGGLIGEMDTPTAGKKHTISKAWFDGEIYYDGANQQIGGITGVIYDETGSTFEFYDCLFSGKIEMTSTQGYRDGAGIISGLLPAGSACKAKLNMANCLNTGEIIGAGSYGIAAAVQHGNGGSIKDCYAIENPVYSKAFYQTGSITVGNNGVLSKTEMKFATDAALLAKLPLLSGQSESPWMCNKLALVPDTPLLKAWATYWDSKQVRTFDVSWYVGHENDATYTLDSKEDLLGFALVAETNNFAGKTIKLGKDIVLNTGKVTDWANSAPTNVWKPVVEFAGKFDGQGHTISGVYIEKLVNYSSNWEAAGFFETLTETAEICNLGIVNSYIRTDTYYTGAIAGISYAKRIENVYSDAYIHNTHSTGTWNGHSLGGLIGEMGTKVAGKTHTISKAWFDGKIYYEGANQQIGGVTGVIYDSKGSTFEFYDCLFSGEIEMTSTQGYRDGAGIVSGVTCGELKMANCLNTGTIKGAGSWGIGAALQGAKAGSIKNCYAIESSVYPRAFYDTGAYITLGDQGVLTANELKFASEDKLLEKLPLLSGQNESSWMCDSTTKFPILKGLRR